MLSRGKDIRMFKHPWLEALTHIHPVVPAAVFAPVVGYNILASMGAGIGVFGLVVLFFLGTFFWTLLEYGLHRTLFHFRPSWKWYAKIHFVIHGIHHDDPTDATRLVMAPVLSIPLAIIFHVLFMVLFGVRAGPIIYAGLVAGYLWYDYTHFYAHHARVTSVWGKQIRRNHLYHHHGDDTANYGVSTPLWDFVFKTYAERRHRRAQKFLAG